MKSTTSETLHCSGFVSNTRRSSSSKLSVYICTQAQFILTNRTWKSKLLHLEYNSHKRSTQTFYLCVCVFGRLVLAVRNGACGSSGSGSVCGFWPWMGRPALKSSTARWSSSSRDVLEGVGRGLLTRWAGTHFTAPLLKIFFLFIIVIIAILWRNRNGLKAPIYFKWNQRMNWYDVIPNKTHDVISNISKPLTKANFLGEFILPPKLLWATSITQSVGVFLNSAFSDAQVQAGEQHL